jgi:hypothetical protein
MYGTSETIKRREAEPISWGSCHPTAGNPLAHLRAGWSRIEIGIVGFLCSTNFKVTNYHVSMYTYACLHTYILYDHSIQKIKSQKV